MQYDLKGSVAYSYARFSDPSQGSGHSLERQQEYAPQFCREYGCRLNTSLRFTDLGKSAFHGRHIKSGGGLARFIECIESGMVREGDILIVENLDRVSRLPLDQAEDLLKSILSQGVRIHVRFPWAIYDKATLRDPSQRMAMIFEFSRGHRESKAKQERLYSRWQANRKRAQEGGYKMATPPGWIKVVTIGNDKHYKVDSEKADLIRKIYQMCVDGMGIGAIAKWLTEREIPTWGGSELWQRSTIAKILNNRAVLGECQMYTAVKEVGKELESTRRVPTGEPIKDYYPAIVDEKLFDRAQDAMANRKINRTGAGTSKCANLFSGLLVSAVDGSRVQVIDKGKGPSLVSAIDLNKRSGAVYLPYRLLEDSFAVYLDAMPLSLVAPKNTKSIDADIHQCRKDIQQLERQVTKLKEKSRQTDSDAILDLLIERSAELRQRQADLDTLERSRGASATVAAETSQELVLAMREAKPSDLLKLRMKLRSELRYWISKIYVLPMMLGEVRAMMATVELTNGETFELRSSADDIEWPNEIVELTARDFAKWPKALRKTEWDVESTFDVKLRELCSQGLSYADIAKALDSTVSIVSKRSLAMGLRRQSKRRGFDKDRQMNWHGVGNGWVRSLKGKRYYVGVGTLAELYPKLVTSRDQEGTQKAANRWWQDQKIGNRE